jgi:hypothetical protein
MVVIGDRLYTLPIIVEGHEVDEANEMHMDVEDGNDGAGNSEDRNVDKQKEDSAQQSKEKKNNNSGPSHCGNTEVVEPIEEDIPHIDNGKGKISNIQGTHNACLNASQEVHAFKKSVLINNDLETSPYTTAEINVGHDKFNGANIQLVGAEPSNSYMNFSQEGSSSYCAEQSKHLSCTIAEYTTTKKVEGKRDEEILAEFIGSPPEPVKRSKRREQSVDEDSNARAGRLKVKKNLDDQGMPKSFLSFSDSKIALKLH